MTRNADSIGTRTCRPARSQEYHGPRVVLVVVLAMVGGNDHGAAQTLWRGLVVAPEVRCAPYDADAYRYPQSVSRLGSLLPWAVCTGPILPWCTTRDLGQ